MFCAQSPTWAKEMDREWTDILSFSLQFLTKAITMQS